MITSYKDYYQILEISRTASAREIRTAYHLLALKFHPDRNAGSRQAEEKFKEINEAYQVLSNPEKRTRYNLLHGASKPAPSSAHRESTSQGQASARSASAPQSRPGNFSRHVEKIKVPSNLEVTKSSQHLRIVRKWFQINAFYQFIPILFILIWSTLFFLEIPFMGFISVMVWIGSIYYAVAICINQTSIELDANSLTIKHGPMHLPLWPDKKLSVKTLKLIFPERSIFYYGRNNEMATVSHKVHAITTDFQEVALLSGLGSRAEALFIVQEIEQFLHLTVV